MSRRWYQNHLEFVVQNSQWSFHTEFQELNFRNKKKMPTLIRIHRYYSLLKWKKKISKRCIQVTKLPTDRGEIYENSHKKDKTLG